MTTSVNRRVALEVFEKHVGLVYSIAWKHCRRRLAQRGPLHDLEEHVQDAVCRALDSFLKRCDKGLPKVADRQAWVCQCAMHAVRRACETSRRFGSPAPCPGYVDALNRRGNSEPGNCRHGRDHERKRYLEDVQYTPVNYAPQRWEVEQVLEDNHVPEHLRKTAIYAAMGLTQQDSALLQGCTDRTVRKRLRELREYLDPAGGWNIYAVVCAALQACMA